MGYGKKAEWRFQVILHLCTEMSEDEMLHLCFDATDDEFAKWVESKGAKVASYKDDNSKLRGLNIKHNEDGDLI